MWKKSVDFPAKVVKDTEDVLFVFCCRVQHTTPEIDCGGKHTNCLEGRRLCIPERSHPDMAMKGQVAVVTGAGGDLLGGACL
jgi:hypothetical protein